MKRRKIDWERRFMGALVQIARGYETSREVIRHASSVGLEPIEALEYAYDNIQQTAKDVLKGYRAPKEASNAETAGSTSVQAEAADRGR